VIVAALETNWNGDYGILTRMIKECKILGIDCIKLQALSKEKIARHTELDWYGNASVSEDNIEKINRICDEYDMKWFCTPFYPEAVDLLDPYVDMYKISYADRKNTNIIEKCMDTNKKIIISTDRPLYTGLKNFCEIYCIPQYPSTYGEINFDMIRTMKGYSNHCLDPLAVLKAKRVGAEYIEIHLTSDSSKFAMDNKVSFNFGQLEEIMKWIK